jgi:hypothetical protein
MWRRAGVSVSDDSVRSSSSSSSRMFGKDVRQCSLFDTQIVNYPSLGASIENIFPSILVQVMVAVVVVIFVDVIRNKMEIMMQ